MVIQLRVKSNESTSGSPFHKPSLLRPEERKLFLLSGPRLARRLVVQNRTTIQRRRDGELVLNYPVEIGLWTKLILHPPDERVQPLEAINLFRMTQLGCVK